MLHIFIGEDDYSIRQAVNTLKKTLGDATALLTNTTLLDGKQVTIEQLRAASETVPFLADKRLVIVEGLLERFDPAGRPTKKKTSRQPEKTDEHLDFAAALKNLPPFTELIITGGKINERNPLFKELASLSPPKAFPLLKGTQLTQWINTRILAAGGTISPQAANMLARLVSNDLWTLAGEVDKLVMYAAGRRIEEKDVKEVASSARDASIFALVDAVLESRVGAAQQLLEQSFRQGTQPPEILAMLARQLRIIFLVKDMRARGKARGEIQAKLGLYQEFLLRKAWEQADKYFPARIREVYHRLLEADLAIKTGRYDDPQVALNIFAAELGRG